MLNAFLASFREPVAPPSLDRFARCARRSKYFELWVATGSGPVALTRVRFVHVLRRCGRAVGEFAEHLKVRLSWNDMKKT